MDESDDEQRRRLNAAKISASGRLRIKQAFDLVHAQDEYRAKYPKEWPMKSGRTQRGRNEGR